MCLRNLSTGRMRADYGRGNFAGPSEPRPSASSTPTVARTGNGWVTPGALRTAPGKLDVAFAAAVFAGFCLLGLLLSAGRAVREWFNAKRVCAWCQVRMGGNPLAGVTHGICPHCLAQKKREILAQQTFTGTGI